MGVTIGRDATKSGNNTHLLVIMLVRISHKIGMYNLANRTGLKKLTARKNIKK